jgi:hypothetical protein
MSRRTLSLSAFLKPILDPGLVPAMFVIGAILLGLIGNAIYDALVAQLEGPLNVVWVSLLLLILLVVTYALLSRLFGRHLVVGDIQPRPGLVTLVSQGRLSEIPATASIRYHYLGENDERLEPTLRHCWLVTSPEPAEEPLQPPDARKPEPFHSSWQNAKALQAMYEGKIDIRLVAIDPDDPEDIFRKVDAVYAEARRLGLASREMVADFSGGTKMMTVGLVLACTPVDRDVEYMRPRQYDARGRAIPEAGSDPRLVDLHFFVRTGEEQEE